MVDMLTMARHVVLESTLFKCCISMDLGGWLMLSMIP